MLTGYSEQEDVAYAVVEIDDDTGVGVGQIDTTNLDDSSIDVDLYRASSDRPTSETDVDADIGSLSVVDDPSMTVEQGEVSITNPRGTYAIGSEITLNGTASSGVDDVAFYVRRQADYRLLDLDSSTSGGTQATLSVDADGTFEQEDIVLSEGNEAGNELLSLPGTYRLGVIDAADADGDGDAGIHTDHDAHADTHRGRRSWLRCRRRHRRHRRGRSTGRAARHLIGCRTRSEDES